MGWIIIGILQYHQEGLNHRISERKITVHFQHRGNKSNNHTGSKVKCLNWELQTQYVARFKVIVSKGIFGEYPSNPLHA